MENVNLSKEELKELRRQEKKDLPIQGFKPGKVDDSKLIPKELKLLNKYRQFYIDNTVKKLPLEYWIINNLKWFMLYMRDMPSQEKTNIITIGRRVSNSMSLTNSMVSELFSLKAEMIQDLGNEIASNLFYSIFPGEPYNRIENSLSQSEYKELKELWWSLQLEKWNLLKALNEEINKNDKENLKGAAANNVEIFNKKLKIHWPELKLAILKTMVSKSFSEIFIENKSVGKGFTNKVYVKYDKIPETTLLKWLDREDVREKIKEAYHSKTTAKPQ